MKIHVIALSSLFIAGIVNAQSSSIPGGYTNRTLDCSSVQHIVGVKYGILVQTQALAPEYFIRGAFLTTTEVYPGAVTNYTPIALQSQNFNQALFSFGNDYKVILNKNNFTAQIFIGNIVYFNCFEKK